jgi:hypothetical protein
LAFACHQDNLRKGPNLTGIDPATKKLTKLFNPRRHKWTYHFRWDGPILIGRTAIGRATAAVLGMNLSHRSPPAVSQLNLLRNSPRHTEAECAMPAPWESPIPLCGTHGLQ